jgi:hypothetical protein
MTKNIDKIVFNVTARECLWPCQSQKKAKKTLKKSTRIKKEKHRTTDNKGKANKDQVEFQKPSHLQDSKQNHSEDKKGWKRKLLFSEQPSESSLTESLEGSLVYSSEGW